MGLPDKGAEIAVYESALGVAMDKCGLAVVQDADAYQRLLDTAARADVFEAIRQGRDDAANGRTITEP